MPENSGLDNVQKVSSIIPKEEGAEDLLGEALSYKEKIDQGNGNPEDLLKYVNLAHQYHTKQLKDPRTASNPEVQKAVAHFTIAKEGGSVGQIAFCVSQMESDIMHARTAEKTEGPKTREDYIKKSQNWAKLVSEIPLREPSSST